MTTENRKLIEREPTPEMLRAGLEAEARGEYNSGIWRAMFDTASPAPSATSEDALRLAKRIADTYAGTPDDEADETLRIARALLALSAPSTESTQLKGGANAGSFSEYVVTGSAPASVEREHEQTESAGTQSGQSNSAAPSQEGHAAGIVSPAYPTCTWCEDEDGNWDTACGGKHIINAGAPAENNMCWCCYCGRTLAEERYQETDDE
jgi:hypothetical protein